MAAFETLDATCEEELKACLGACDELNGIMSSNDATEKDYAAGITECENLLKKVKQSRRNLGTEMTQIKDRAVRNEKAARVKYFDDEIQRIGTLIQKAKTQQGKLSLMKEARSLDNRNSTEGKGNDELLDATNKVQDMTFASLGRTKMLIEQSKEVGTATIEELQRQRVQMHEIEEDIDLLETNLDRAEKLVVNFTRRMASDKIIQCFMVFNIVIIIIVAVYAGVTGKSLSSKSSHGSDNFFGTHYPTSMPSTFHPTVSRAPSEHPTLQPSASPTTLRPSPTPSQPPTRSPSAAPTFAPSATPSFAPSTEPSVEPTAAPT